MSVVHFLPTFDTGGLGTVGLAMIRAWPEKTRHVVLAPRYLATRPVMYGDFATLCGGGSVVQIDKHAFMSPPVWGRLLAANLAQVLRGNMPTHIINYSFLDLVWNLFGVRAFGYKGPVLAHVGTVLPDRNDTRSIATSKFNDLTRFIPVSDAARKSVLHLGASGVLPTVWNGVVLSDFEAPRRTKALTFGFAGRMPTLTVKDWKTLLGAFRAAAIPGSVLRIAGDGDGRKAVEELAQGLNVEFLGNVPAKEMSAFMRGLDVFVMAALPFEGFSVALSEAIASRCLVLGTDVPSVRELLAAHGGKGFLAKTAPKMAKLMVALQDEKQRELNDAMVTSARAALDATTMAKTYFDAGRQP